MSRTVLYRFQFRSGRSVIVPLTEEQAWAYVNAMLGEETSSVMTSKVRGMSLPFVNTGELEFICKEGKVIRGRKKEDQEVRLQEAQEER